MDQNFEHIDNQHFLTVLFQECLDNGQAVFYCSVPNAPNITRPPAMTTAAPDVGTDPLMNNFFCMSSMGDPLGRRVKANVEACIGIFLDDIGAGAGSKAEIHLESLPESSWAIESSPGNYQVGFLFNQPLKDQKLASSIYKALAASRIGDAGGQNPLRWARLPVGSNRKPKYKEEDGSFPTTRLVHWKPEIRYDPIVLATALGLDLSGKGRAGPEEDPTFEDKDSENPVLVALKTAGLYKFNKGGGVHEVSCPWRDEHTDQKDDGAAYFEPTEDYRIGGFKCHHSHGATKNIRALLAVLKVEPSKAQNRPLIRLRPGDLHRIVDAGERVLHGAGFFQQGGTVVAVRAEQKPKGKEWKLHPLLSTTLEVELTRHAQLQKWNPRLESWEPTDCPPKVGAAVACDPHRRYLRPILAMARQPFLRVDGSLCQSSGYDPESQIFGTFNPADFSFPKLHPTKADAQEAMGTLEELVAEMEFKDPTDKAAALSAFLTAVVRPVLPTAPAFLMNAHDIGSGKSYLQDMVVALATPLEAAVLTFTPDDEEMRKLLVAKLMEAPPAIRFDEMTSDLVPVKAVLSTITSEQLEGRRLGHSQLLTASTRTLLLFAGNNIAVIRDMVRRTVVINLDPAIEIPALKKFTTCKLTELRADRGRYIAAALTVILAWIENGGPKVDGFLPTINNFALWSDWCRMPLIWLGYPEPCQSMFNNLESDPSRDQLMAFIHELEAAIGGGGTFSVKSLIDLAQGREALGEVLREIAPDRSGTIDRKALGRFLKRNKGRKVMGRVITESPLTRNALQFVLTKAQDAPESIYPEDDAAAKSVESVKSDAFADLVSDGREAIAVKTNTPARNPSDSTDFSDSTDSAPPKPKQQRPPVKTTTQAGAAPAKVDL